MLCRNNDSDLTVLHSTLIENCADSCGGGVYAGQYSHVEVENSILWADVTDGPGPELCIKDNSEVIVIYSDVQGRLAVRLSILTASWGGPSAVLTWIRCSPPCPIMDI